jgi:hypothetical protein
MDLPVDLLRRGTLSASQQDAQTLYSTVLRRGIYHHSPPPYADRNARNPTLLVSWWCTIFALTTILIRIMGRWVRTERLFREDKLMLWSIIPLMVRMGLVHVILIWGTNNTVTDGLTRQEILHRETGSKLVLVARIFYAAFIWIAKLTVLEFLKRTTTTTWSRTYDRILQMIYGFLALTFIAIVVGTLCECRPFPHYWQVVPDPGPQCREGLVQLIVMGVCDMVTDIVLIAFPIPVVLSSSMPFRKKLSMITLFSLSAILIAITAYRIPSTIARQADQPFRSLLASLEILAATGVSNAVIIGSFIRDKGVKKAKFRAASVGDSVAGSANLQRITTARSQAVTLHHWGSDEDLVRDMGVALPPTLRFGPGTQARAPSAAPPYQPPLNQSGRSGGHGRKSSQLDGQFSFSRSRSRHDRRGSATSASTTSTDIKLRDLQASLDEPVSPGANIDTEPLSKQMSFFDVGGLVDSPKTDTRSSQTRPHVGHRSGSGSESPAVGRGRSGSKAFLSDIGGLLGRHREEEDESSRHSISRSLTPSRLMDRRKTSRSPNPVKRLQQEEGGAASSSGASPRVTATQSPMIKPTDEGPDSLIFGDVGGLLQR